MNDARRQLQQALQESLDRRDNGGPAGMVPAPSRPAEPERAEQRPEPPVSEWARDQLQHAFN